MNRAPAAAGSPQPLGTGLPCVLLRPVQTASPDPTIILLQPAHLALCLNCLLKHATPPPCPDPSVKLCECHWPGCDCSPSDTKHVPWCGCACATTARRYVLRQAVANADGFNEAAEARGAGPATRAPDVLEAMAGGGEEEEGEEGEVRGVESAECEGGCS